MKTSYFLSRGSLAVPVSMGLLCWLTAAQPLLSYFVNGGFTLMRDAFEQRLLDGTTLDTQGYRPAVVYINGDY